MNYALSREIYGLTPWMMDIHSLSAMTSILRDIKSGVTLEVPEVKLNTPFIYNLNNETRVVDRPYGNYYYAGQLENNDDFLGIGVIEINGPITVSGGASSLGMEQLASLMLEMSLDQRIKSFIILANSGGGSSSAVELMVDAISQVRGNGIPVDAIIKKGGTACSACYGIISACRKIYAESELSIVGSLGTMIQFEGREANSKSKDGKKFIRVYATKSVRKNEEFEEALNNDNYSLLVDNLLDPINESFLSQLKSNRPLLNESHFDGHTTFAKNSVGSFIDGIKSFNELVSEMEIELESSNNNNNNNKNKDKMTQEELQNNHPEVYNSILAEGVASERDRTGAWLAHIDADAEAVVAGISSEKAISSTQREQFFVKANSKKTVKELKEGSQAPVVPAPALSAEELAKKETEKEIDQAFDFEL